MVELSSFDIVCCKVPILISTVDDRGYLSNYSSFSLVFVEVPLHNLTQSIRIKKLTILCSNH